MRCNRARLLGSVASHNQSMRIIAGLAKSREVYKGVNAEFQVTFPSLYESIVNGAAISTMGKRWSSRRIRRDVLATGARTA